MQAFICENCKGEGSVVPAPCSISCLQLSGGGKHMILLSQIKNVNMFGYDNKVTIKLQ